MGLEMEYKFTPADPKLFEEMEAHYQDGYHYNMHTLYFDTPNHLLRARRMTFRQRMENDVMIYTLKVPSPRGRHEHEVELTDTPEAAFTQLCHLSGQTELLPLAQSGLIPVGEVKFHRIAHFYYYDDALVELDLDRGEFISKDGNVPFTEVEVELRRGPYKRMWKVAMEVSQKYDLDANSLSKYARAVALNLGIKASSIE